MVYQGHVTSGVTAADIAELSAIGKSPFQIQPEVNEDAVWVEADRVCVRRGP